MVGGKGAGVAVGEGRVEWLGDRVFRVGFLGQVREVPQAPSRTTGDARGSPLSMSKRSHPLPPLPPSANVRPMPKKPEASPVAAFEQSLDELEKLVASMEQGDLSLDDSLKAFERGIALFRQCQGALSEAEQRVNLLLDPQQADSAQPFEP